MVTASNERPSLKNSLYLKRVGGGVGASKSKHDNIKKKENTIRYTLIEIKSDPHENKILRKHKNPDCRLIS